MNKTLIKVIAMLPSDLHGTTSLTSKWNHCRVTEHQNQQTVFPNNNKMQKKNTMSTEPLSLVTKQLQMKQFLSELI